MISKRWRGDRATSNEVYVRGGVVVREFGDPSDDEERVYQALMRMLPELIRLYEHVYVGLPDTNPTFPWADGKDETEKRKKRAASTPFLQRPCTTKVAATFVWPVYAAFRSALEWRTDGTLAFKIDPFELFDEIKGQLATPVINFFKRTKVITQLGRDKEVWVRLDGVVTNELTIRKRLSQAG